MKFKNGSSIDKTINNYTLVGRPDAFYIFNRTARFSEAFTKWINGDLNLFHAIVQNKVNIAEVWEKNKK